MYEYRCKIVKVVDGDTVDVDIDLGFGVWLENERVRLIGIDAPESRTSDPVEKVFGLYAKEWLCEKLPVGSIAILVSEEFKGKFGRILGDIKISEGCITEMMLDERLVVPYYGQSKDAIVVSHEENRKYLLENKKVVF